MGASRGLAQALGVAQPLALGRQLGLLGRVGRHLLYLGELVAVEVEVALPRAVALAQLGELGVEPQALAVGFPVAVAELELGGAGEAVEDVHLGRGDRQLAVLVLAVEGEQPAAEQLQVGGGRRAAGDEGRGPPRGRDPAAEDDLLGALRQALGEIGQLGVLEQPCGQVEGPSTQASSAPGLTIWGRALPPISRSSEWASTVLPAPVSPVIALSPSPSRSSARSISSRFSIRNSRSMLPV